ncbi:mannose-P-dolichol utilization defect 1 protein homolog 2 isoform X2 [Tripterygium wilfordii]|uniref:mannose-P-dolichol utilization defect 1 protein homolog 2 isoform X2 n=1 Tax=Tripterygium wilfordii TaxID=458696 RepID=UPI0018F84A0F|nr:mannose-P-dolichol utilization defect 1 protein homolog 2 isoform X2 [Tripterygium wilfordii]
MEYIGIDISCALGSLHDGEFPDKACLLPLISKLLGYAIVAASTTVKLPQILKILKNRSVRGLSVTAFEMEVIGYTITLAYCLHKGLAFSAFGEYAFLLIQAIILVAIIYYYSQPLGTATWIRAFLYCAIAPTVLAGQASQHAIFLFARIPQIWQNFSNKSTGELSFLTCFMNFCGSMARFFTNIQENAPTSSILALNLLVSCSMCLHTLCFQLFFMFSQTLCSMLLKVETINQACLFKIVC